MSPKPDKPFNSRTYQGQVERELIIGGILITIVVGGGLIALIWGSTAFFTALACFASILGLIVIVWLFLKVLEIVSRD
ncbi:MAG: hypothetical protein KGJ80_01955 [Chloroflexota bacterium]|nr:hypothetical protein [Chloroflexota bacterium]